MAKSKGKIKGAEYNSPFPTRLRECLEREGETQDRLAKYLGVKRQSVGYWKDGDTAPDVNTLGRISEYYKVSADYLLGRAECKSRSVEEVHKLIGLSEDALRVLEAKKYSQVGHYLEDGKEMTSYGTPNWTEKNAKNKEGFQIDYEDRLIRTLNALLENTEGIRALEDMAKFLFGEFANVDRASDTDTGAYFRYRIKGQEAVEFLDASKLSAIFLVEMQDKLSRLRTRIQAPSEE